MHRSDVEPPSGRRIAFHSIHDRKIGVGAVPRRPGEVALIRQYRPTVERELWQPVANVIPRGTAPLTPCASCPDLEETTDSPAIRGLAHDAIDTVPHESTSTTGCWGISSGGAEPHEDPAAAAAREMLEETGHRARATRPLVRYHPSYGVGDEVFDIYEADVDAAPPVAFDADEVRWFTEADVAAMCLSGEIVDGLSLTPLLLPCAREGWSAR